MNSIKVNSDRGSIVPKNLLDTNLYNYLDTLIQGLDNSGSVYELSDLKSKNLEVAVTEFLDLVMFTEKLEYKHYLKKRLLRLKSVEKVLWQIEKYAPIVFDSDIDPDYIGTEQEGILNTRYSPRLLKVVIQSLTINNLAQNFVEIIDSMFNNLLYFLEYDLDIKELIYNITVDLKSTVIGYTYTPVRVISLDLGIDNN